MSKRSTSSSNNNEVDTTEAKRLKPSTEANEGDTTAMITTAVATHAEADNPDSEESDEDLEMETPSAHCSENEVNVLNQRFSYDEEKGFPSALDRLEKNERREEMPRKVLELTLISFVGGIRDRVNWPEKVMDENIVAQWKKEALQHCTQPLEEAMAGFRSKIAESVALEDYHRAAELKDEKEATERQIQEAKKNCEPSMELAVAEAKFFAQAYSSSKANAAAADGTFMRDDLPQELQQRLMHGVRLLRSKNPVGCSSKNEAVVDYHPGSKDLVVDLIHPSLYAYERGRTPLITSKKAAMQPSNDSCVSGLVGPPWNAFASGGSEEELVAMVERRAREQESAQEKPEKNHAARRSYGGFPWNHHDSGDDDDDWENLTSQGGLQWLPAEVLCTMSPDGTYKCDVNSYINNLHPNEFPQLYTAISDAFVHCLPLFESVLAMSDMQASKEGRYEPRPHRVPAWSCNLPNEFVPPPIPDHLPAGYLLNQPLQVIVKIARIELSPSGKSSFDGGTWHVEGMQEEHIVATACVYLESENVGETRLDFRTQIKKPFTKDPRYEDNDEDTWSLTQDDDPAAEYGMPDGSVLAQPRGSTRCLSGRALCWPNTLQHKVAPFELQNKEEPGFRTILCFFLIDPTERVVSTSTVPPQQLEWIQHDARGLLLLTTLKPLTVRNVVVSFLGGDGTMTYEEAKDRRERLMRERKAAELSACMTHASQRFYVPTVSFCEH